MHTVNMIYYASCFKSENRNAQVIFLKHRNSNLSLSSFI